MDADERRAMELAVQAACDELERRIRTNTASESPAQLLAEFYANTSKAMAKADITLLKEYQAKVQLALGPLCDEGLLTGPDITAGLQAAVASRMAAAASLDDNGTTPLMRACSVGQLEDVKRLVAARASVHESRADGRTAMMISAAHNRVDCMQVLLAHGAKPEYTKPDGGCAIMVAAQNGALESVLWLLDRGCSVNQAKHDGTTAIMCAAAHGQAAAVRLLRRCGAALNQKNCLHIRAIDLAVRNQHADCVEALLDAGADASRMEVGDDRLSLASVAATCGNWDIFQLLVMRHDSAVNNSHLRSLAAQLAIGTAGGPICIRILLDHCPGFHIDGDVPEDDGESGIEAILTAGNGLNRWSLLDCACEAGCLESVQLLSSRGASRKPPTPDYFPPANLTLNPDSLPPLPLASFAEEVAMDNDQQAVLSWLIESRRWSSELHHACVLDASRVRFLLHRGDDPYACARGYGWGRDPDAPLEVAKRWLASRAACSTPSRDAFDGPVTDGAMLVVRACEPWSATTHELFPPTERGRAVQILRLGYLLARPFPGFIDCWRAFVMPLCIVRVEPRRSSMWRLDSLFGGRESQSAVRP